jgi:phosphoglycolate phosphatase
MRFGARIEAVIIDLDGTLLDTAPDLAEAANRMLGDLDMPLRTGQEVASFVGRGIENLVARSIGAAHAADPATLANALEVFNRHYAAVSGVHVRVFAGVREGLAAFRAQGLKLACITNKAGRFTLPLLDQLELRGNFSLVVSGDSLPRKKPDPLPLLHVCSQFGVAPGAALMIGDSPNDAQAARAAGCPVACVPYGYREGLEVRELDCDVIVSTLAEAASLVQGSNLQHAAP